MTGFPGPFCSNEKLEMPAKTPFYITTAISYPNGPPHIGHAYEAIATDAIARFMRLDGYDVYFLTGTDEHGQKIQQTAAREGLTPRQLLDRNVPRFEAMVKRMNCSNDDFIHTTEERHHRSSEAIWQRMEQNGDIYLGKYAGWYSVRDEAYYAEDETHLNEQKVRVSAKTGTPVEWVEEASYFFKLSAYQEKLLELYKRPDFVLPKERLNEVASFVRGGLQDLSISRTTFDWGIRVPGADGHIMYVWVDALTNYITGVGFPDTGSEKFKRYWPAALHVIGKDIVRFHAVYWPAFLMSAGIAVPQRIFSHGFLFNRGEKMSKSVGNVIDPFTMADTYGVDQFRYFFLREVPFRPGRQLQPRSDRQPHQCRSRQRSRKFGAALPVDDYQGKRRETRGAGCFQRKRQDHSGVGGCHDRHGARAHENTAASPRSQLHLGGRSRRQPLLCVRSALGSGKDRSEAAGNGPLCDCRNFASGRHPGAAVCPDLRVEIARPAGDQPGRSQL
jgi:valyl-tRNA synthetase